MKRGDLTNRTTKNGQPLYYIGRDRMTWNGEPMLILATDPTNKNTFGRYKPDFLQKTTI